MHIGGLILWPDTDPPLPVFGRLPVRCGYLLTWLVGGPSCQLSGGPPVHEKPRFLAFAPEGEEAGGLADGDLLRQATPRPQRRYWQPVQLGEVWRQLRPDRAGDA